MEEEIVEKCSFCDMDLPKDCSDNSINSEFLQLKSVFLQKYVPKFKSSSVPELNNSCKECLKYIKDFDANYSKWKCNEQDTENKEDIDKCGIQINQLKKNSLNVCRLCLKQTNLKESYEINDDDHGQYRKGYLQQIINLHAPFIDLKLTKDPIMCMTCLNVMQTFDAFYRMCCQTFMIRRKSLNSTKNDGVETSKTVEIETASVKPESSANTEELPADVCVISDDEEVAVVQPTQESKRKARYILNEPPTKKTRLSIPKSSSEVLSSTSNIGTTPTATDILLGKKPTVDSKAKEGVEYTIVEIDDSDSEDSDDELSIVSGRMVWHRNKNEAKENKDGVKADSTELEQAPEPDNVSIEINMTNVQKLFQTTENLVDCVVYNKNTVEIEESNNSLLDVEVPSSSIDLQSNPSDVPPTENPSPECMEDNANREATITPCYEINMTSLKKMLDTNKEKNENNQGESVKQHPRGPQAYHSSYEDFLKGNVNYKDANNGTQRQEDVLKLDTKEKRQPVKVRAGAKLSPEEEKKRKSNAGYQRAYRARLKAKATALLEGSKLKLGQNSC